VAVVDLRPLPVRRDPGRRVPQLLGGLVLYGLSMAMAIRAGLGLSPWGVLHEGLAHRTGLSYGAVTGVVGAVVLLLWIPLQERPGLGTVADVVVVAVAVDAALLVLPVVTEPAARIALLLGGTVGVGTVLYALAIGPLTQLFLPRFAVRGRP
jgi:uncharacterized membrane protein YczE